MTIKKKRKRVKVYIWRYIFTIKWQIIEAGTCQSFIGRVLTINPQGLLESKRRVFDGVSYFGSIDKNSEEEVNDFTLPEECGGLTPKHFKIFYKKDENEYYLQDLEEDVGTFLKVENYLVILNLFQIVQNGDMYSFGNFHLIVNFNNSIDSILNVQLTEAREVTESL